MKVGEGGDGAWLDLRVEASYTHFFDSRSFLFFVWFFCFCFLFCFVFLFPFCCCSFVWFLLLLFFVVFSFAEVVHLRFIYLESVCVVFGVVNSWGGGSQCLVAAESSRSMLRFDFFFGWLGFLFAVCLATESVDADSP